MKNLAAFLLCAAICRAFGEAKVLELSDKFLPLRNEGMWLVKFYAPWCGHCKKLEPIFKHVGQSLSHENIRIGRIDCTRFPSVASEFGIKGYPTIMFLKGDLTFTYEGDRTREDIVAFSMRLLGPPVKTVSTLAELKSILSARDMNFVFIGDTKGKLWDTYHDIAKHFQQHEFFYQVPSEIAKEITEEDETDVIRVFKDGTSFKFNPEDLSAVRSLRSSEDQTEEGSGKSDLAASMANWVSRERFPLFVKITRGKFHQLMTTGKYVVMAVLEENKIGELTPEMEEFRDMLKMVVHRNEARYRDYFQFLPAPLARR